MSQDIFDSIDPAMSGTDLAGTLNDFKAALMSGLSGPSRPTELEPGGMWIDTSNDPTSWSFRLWTGSDDIEVFKIDLSGGGAGVSLAVDSFSIRKTSEDDVGALLELVKRRVASNGQVKSGDVVAEIRAVGRQDSGGNPVVAKIIYTASEDQTNTAFGGTLSFFSTPEGSAVLVEHMKFVNGVIESLVPHRLNATELVSQEVASTATIAKLSASKAVVEITGSTATDIQGIAGDGLTKTIVIHNRATQNVTLKNQNGTASTNDRLLLPEGLDVIIKPQETATLLYSVADSRWKIQSKIAEFKGFTTVKVFGSQTIPIPVGQMEVTAIKKEKDILAPNLTTTTISALTGDGSIFAWGRNFNGSLGTNTASDTSSPVAVVGGIKFRKVVVGGFGNSMLGLAEDGLIYTWGGNQRNALGFPDSVNRSVPTLVNTMRFKDIAASGDSSMFALREDGVLYAWGYNSNSGLLGTGNNTNFNSSPTLVVGGYNFKRMWIGWDQESRFAQLENGQMYAWGFNGDGKLGVGDTVSRSSPTLVAGGLVFKNIIHRPPPSTTNMGVFGLLEDGTLYAWGDNSSGHLGVGDTVSRSSPVAVLGGLKFREVVLSQGARSCYGITLDGDLYAWGQNSFGRLGVGDVAHRSSPVLVMSGQNVIKVLPHNSSYVLCEDGTLYAWGDNLSGQLGVGDTTSRSSPVAVLGGIKFREVVEPLPSAFNSMFAISEDGTLYAWGANDHGHLGVGDMLPRSSPVAVLGGIKAKKVWRNMGVICVAEDGTMYAWGDNTYGQIGVGDTTPRSSPVAVLGGVKFGKLEDSFTRYFNVTPGDQTIQLLLGRAYINGEYIGKDIDELQITYANP